MEYLPAEILHEIYAYVPLPTLLKNRRINKIFYDSIALFFNDRKIPTDINQIITNYLSNNSEYIKQLFQIGKQIVRFNILRLIFANNQDEFYASLIYSKTHLYDFFRYAAINGRLDLIKMHSSTIRDICSQEICYLAAENNHFNIVVWIINYEMSRSMHFKPTISVFGQDNYDYIFGYIMKHGNEDMMDWSINHGYSWENMYHYMKKNGISNNYQILITKLKKHQWINLPTKNHKWINVPTKILKMVIYHENMDLLKWLTENKDALQFRMNYGTIYAARFGKLEILKWLVKNGYPINEDTCYNAARCDNLYILQWLRKKNCPWDGRVCEIASEYGKLEIFAWALENGCHFDNPLGIINVNGKYYGISDLGTINVDGKNYIVDLVKFNRYKYSMISKIVIIISISFGIGFLCQKIVF